MASSEAPLAPALTRSRQGASPKAGLARRAGLLGALLCVEILSLHAPYYGALAGARVADAKIISLSIAVSGGVICFLTAFALASWPSRAALIADWKDAARNYNWKPWAGFSAALAILLAACTLLARHTSAGAAIPLAVLTGAWLAGILVMILALFAAFAPARFWRETARARWKEIAVALGAVLFVYGIALLAQGSWKKLSQATLAFSYWIVSHLESGAHADVRHRLIGVRNFTVEISPACSGYEGIGLALGFVAIYIALFRRHLRFPNVLLLFPIAGAIAWVFNAVRIAALITLGAHVSPGMAMHGFHSQAGSLSFLAIAIGIIYGTSRIGLFARPGAIPARRADHGSRLAAAYLLPFAVMMTGSILTSMFLRYGKWFYVFDLACIASLVWFYRDIYRALRTAVSADAIIVGTVVGLLWAWTQPQGALGDADQAIFSLHGWTAAIWIALRGLIFIAAVPFAEELAFRGYLHRALIARRFETVEPGRFAWPAFIVSTGLFGLMHARPVAGLFAGAAFALVMYRSNRLSDPIAAHATSNLVIALIALCTRNWSLF